MARTPPTLTVIDPASKPDRLAPPASLGKVGAELWRNLLNDYVIEDSAGCQMLLRICETADFRYVVMALSSSPRRCCREGRPMRLPQES